ncbi:hypothetical protein HAX54_002896, partial [Datura stramonium]|nr:hypothetical protein [Datura stramonium]
GDMITDIEGHGSTVRRTLLNEYFERTKGNLCKQKGFKPVPCQETFCLHRCRSEFDSKNINEILKNVDQVSEIREEPHLVKGKEYMIWVLSISSGPLWGLGGCSKNELVEEENSTRSKPHGTQTFF